MGIIVGCICLLCLVVVLLKLEFGPAEFAMVMIPFRIARMLSVAPMDQRDAFEKCLLPLPSPVVDWIHDHFFTNDSLCRQADGTI